MRLGVQARNMILNGFTFSAVEFAFYLKSDGEPCKTFMHENDMVKFMVQKEYSGGHANRDQLGISNCNPEEK